MFFNGKYGNLQEAESKHDGIVVITLMVQVNNSYQKATTLYLSLPLKISNIIINIIKVILSGIDSLETVVRTRCSSCLPGEV